MKLFDVYSLLDMEPVKASGAYLWDKEGVEYLDFYGGHAVISIGHTHPHYVEKITEQLSKIGFYSNAVINNLQVELAEKFGVMSIPMLALRPQAQDISLKAQDKSRGECSRLFLKEHCKGCRALCFRQQ